MDPSMWLRIYGSVALTREGWRRPPGLPQISVAFRCALVLMILGDYAYGDHVHDDRAFVLRCRRLPQRAAWPRDQHLYPGDQP